MLGFCVHQHRGLDEIAALARASAADHRPGAFGPSGIQKAHHAIELFLGNEWTHLCVRLVTGTEFDFLCRRGNAV